MREAVLEFWSRQIQRERAHEMYWSRRSQLEVTASWNCRIKRHDHPNKADLYRNWARYHRDIRRMAQKVQQTLNRRFK